MIMKKTESYSKEKSRENVIALLKSGSEEVFHHDKELAFLRDRNQERLLIVDLDKRLIVELEVPFEEAFAVEKIKVDKNRKGFTMSGRHGAVWFDLESCWEKAKLLQDPKASPFPEIVIDQERAFSIHQEMDEFLIYIPLAKVGEIVIRPDEMGLLHLGTIFQFDSYPAADDRIIDYLMPVTKENDPILFEKDPFESSLSDYTGEEILMREMANDLLEEIIDEDFFRADTGMDLLHVKWTMYGIHFECKTEDISFSFSEPTDLWGAETDEYLYTVLLEVDEFDVEKIRGMVDYFRTYEGDEVMRIIQDELAAFLKNPDWNAFLRWSYDGTLETAELRKLLEKIVRASVDYLYELGLE
jgi:hypothetical protein